MARVNIFSKEWCDIVFNKRNKDYGAYELRQLASKRQFFAFLIAAIFFLTAFTIPEFLKNRNVGDKDNGFKGVIAFSGPILNPPINNQPDALKKFDEQREQLRNVIAFPPPLISDNVPDGMELRMQDDIFNRKAIVGTFTYNDGIDDPTINDLPLNDQKKIVEDPDKIVDFVEQMPDYPGGPTALAIFLKDNLKYPFSPAENGITGTVWVKFVVTKTGKISDIKIARGIHPELDREALRVVSLMPDWRPGIQNGKAVAVNFNLSIKFQLQQ